MSEHDGGGGLAGGDITLTQPLNHSKKTKKTFAERSHHESSRVQTSNNI